MTITEMYPDEYQALLEKYQGIYDTSPAGRKIIDMLHGSVERAAQYALVQQFNDE